jgi:hypothetical protein
MPAQGQAGTRYLTSPPGCHSGSASASGTRRYRCHAAAGVAPPPHLMAPESRARSATNMRVRTCIWQAQPRQRLAQAMLGSGCHGPVRMIELTAVFRREMVIKSGNGVACKLSSYALEIQGGTADDATKALPLLGHARARWAAPRAHAWLPCAGDTAPCAFSWLAAWRAPRDAPISPSAEAPSPQALLHGKPLKIHTSNQAITPRQ